MLEKEPYDEDAGLKNFSMLIKLQRARLKQSHMKYGIWFEHFDFSVVMLLRIVFRDKVPTRKG